MAQRWRQAQLPSMVGQRSTLIAGGVQGRTKRQPSGATNEERGRARLPDEYAAAQPTSERSLQGGQPLQATDMLNHRTQFRSGTTQSHSRPARNDCREVGAGPWVRDMCALLHPTLIARGAQGRTDRGARSSEISYYKRAVMRPTSQR